METKLAKLIKEKGVKPYDIAKAIGLKAIPLGVDNCMKGKSAIGNMSYNNLKFLADYLGVGVEDLVEDYELDGRAYRVKQANNVFKRARKKLTPINIEDKPGEFYYGTTQAKGSPVFTLLEDNEDLRSMSMITYENGRVMMLRMEFLTEEFNPQISYKTIDLTPLIYRYIQKGKGTSSSFQEKNFNEKNKSLTEGGSSGISGSFKLNFGKQDDTVDKEEDDMPFLILPIDFSPEDKAHFLIGDNFIPEFMLGMKEIYQDGDRSKLAQMEMESAPFYESAYYQLLGIGVK